MFSFPAYISWDNTRGPILHLAPEPIILSCSTCQTSLKLSPASWPIHLLCLPWPRHLENWDPAVKTQIFILPKSQQYMALVRGKRKKTHKYWIQAHPIYELSIHSHFSFSASKSDYVFCLGWPLCSELNFWTMLCGLTPSSLPCAPSDINKLSLVSASILNCTFMPSSSGPVPLLYVVPSLTPLTHLISYFFSSWSQGRIRWAIAKFLFKNHNYISVIKIYWLLNTIPGSDDKMITKRRFLFPKEITILC